MSEVTVMFTLPSDAFEALQATARRDGSAPGSILRNALRRELKTRSTKTDKNGNDPVFVAALRTLLARDIVEAKDWGDLDSRLLARGYDLRFNEGRLALFAKDSGECLIDSTEIGASYGALMRRFDGPIPASKMMS